MSSGGPSVGTDAAHDGTLRRVRFTSQFHLFGKALDGPVEREFDAGKMRELCAEVLLCDTVRGCLLDGLHDPGAEMGGAIEKDPVYKEARDVLKTTLSKATQGDGGSRSLVSRHLVQDAKAGKCMHISDGIRVNVIEQKFKYKAFEDALSAKGKLKSGDELALVVTIRSMFTCGAMKPTPKGKGTKSRKTGQGNARLKVVDTFYFVRSAGSGKVDRRAADVAEMIGDISLYGVTCITPVPQDKDIDPDGIGMQEHVHFRPTPS